MDVLERAYKGLTLRQVAFIFKKSIYNTVLGKNNIF